MPDDPAWSDDNLNNPHAVADKAQRVERMFAAIAPRYDLNNRLHSMWRDQAWRRAAVKLAQLKPTDTVLDVACGTGDLAIAFRDALVGLFPKPSRWRTVFELIAVAMGQERKLRHRRPEFHRFMPCVIGVDFTYEMLSIAYKKGIVYHVGMIGSDDPADYEPAGIAYLNGDAMSLPIADASVDVVSIAFGLRNVADPHKALAEFHRVLRSGGRLIVLEFATPTNPLVRFFDRIYRERIMPVTAAWIAGDKVGAYRYLPRSVSTFADPRKMMQMLSEAGFRDLTAKPMTCGIAVAYRGTKSG